MTYPRLCLPVRSGVTGGRRGREAEEDGERGRET